MVFQSNDTLLKYDMNLVFKHMSYEEALDLLNKMSPEFSPPLSDTLKLELYADKLAQNATFLIYKEDDEIKGSIVFYPNLNTSKLYIPLVWVEQNTRGLGVAKRMFDTLIEFGKNNKFSNIELEVLKINNTANNLYNSLGFCIIEDRTSKILMRLTI